MTVPFYANMFTLIM